MIRSGYTRLTGFPIHEYHVVPRVNEQGVTATLLSLSLLEERGCHSLNLGSKKREKKGKSGAYFLPLLSLNVADSIRWIEPFGSCTKHTPSRAVQKNISQNRIEQVNRTDPNKK